MIPGTSPSSQGLDGRRVLVTGATGYVASRLIPELIKARALVRVTSRSPEPIGQRFPEVDAVASDLSDPDSLDAAVKDMDVVYYLVHSMAGKDFAETDRIAARNLLAAADRHKVGRIVYLSGLGRPDDDLSAHLASRHEVGEILASGKIPVTEVRAAIVVGSGSSAFDMLRYLTERLPVMIAPRWLSTRIQPIGEDDLVSYLVAAGAEPTPGGIVEVGGADVVTYRQMIHGYATLRRLRRLVISIPLLTPRLSSYWVQLMTPVPTSVSRPLIDGLQNEVVVTEPAAATRFPAIIPVTFETAAVAALARQSDILRAELANGTGVPGSTVALLTEQRRIEFETGPEGSTSLLTDFGGDASWYPVRWAWGIRKWIDAFFGGQELSWIRPDGPVVPGSVVDWWDVEEAEPSHLVLRARMKTPGEAWLAFRIEGDGSRRTLMQTAAFRPRGLLGRLYWWALWPFHRPIFGLMAKRLAKRLSTGRPAQVTSSNEVALLKP